MVINIDCVFNDIKFDQKLKNVFKTYNKFINYRFDYVLRASIIQLPDELNQNFDCSIFGSSQKTELTSIDNDNNLNNVNKLREELKNLMTEVNLKKKEIDKVVINEEGLKKNIKHLEDIIKKKEDLIQETITCVNLKKTAREKVQREYNTANKKYNKILIELNKANKLTNTNTSSSNGSSKSSNSERLHVKAKKYEAKIEKMNNILKITGNSKEKVQEYQITLQTYNDRLKLFSEQLNIQFKNKQALTLSLAESEKRMQLLKINLSNLGVLSSIEKSRVDISSKLIRGNMKKEFLELQNMRNDILSVRPRGMFNPKYQKEKNLTKLEIRKYFENDEAIDSIDYLIELKNNEVFNSGTDLLKYIQMNSCETTIFMKCLSNLSIDEVKKLLIHFFIKVVDLKESGRESDEIIAKLDELNDKQRRNIMSLNNSYQEFHLSIEKKFVSLKKFYQEKLNQFFSLLNEENNALTALKRRQEISNLKKRIQELEKYHAALTVKPKEVLMVPQPHTSVDHLEASKSGSETMSSAKVTYHKNKLKIQKNKSK